MKNQNFNKGITLTALGSFWWGVIGVLYFKWEPKNIMKTLII